MVFKPAPELFDALLSQNNIMCSKPSLFLQDIRKSASQMNRNDDFLKIKFLKALPNHVRMSLVTYNSDNLEELTCVADTLLAYIIIPIVLIQIKFLPSILVLNTIMPVVISVSMLSCIPQAKTIPVILLTKTLALSTLLLLPPLLIILALLFHKECACFSSY